MTQCCQCFTEESLLEALGDSRLVSALTSIWDWNFERARGQIAQYQLSSNRRGHPGALEFVHGYLRHQKGDPHGADQIFSKANDLIDDETNPALKGELYSAWGTIRHVVGDDDRALELYHKALACLDRTGNVRDRAVTMGQIADILQQRGQTDEALRIRREEQLPELERLGDVRSKAVTMGKIADILQQRGQTDEALRIRREDEFPVYERLGDVRSKAVTMGQIADILVSRGDIHEAIRIYREILSEVEALGDLYLMIRCRTQLGIALTKRGYKKDAPIIREHLLWALAEAEKRQYVREADQLRQIVNGLPIQ